MTHLALNDWYLSVTPRNVDLIGDFGGSELFIVNGDSLIYHFMSDPNLFHLNLDRDSVTGEFLSESSPLLLIFLIEKFCSDLISRGAKFHIVFFDSMELNLSQGDPRLLALREIIWRHLCTRCPSLFIFKFQNWINDSEWDSYVTDFQPIFALVTDGTRHSMTAPTSSTSTSPSPSPSTSSSLPPLTSLWQGFIFDCLTRSVSIALLDGFLFRDSKVIANVFDRFHGSMDATLLLSDSSVKELMESIMKDSSKIASPAFSSPLYSCRIVPALELKDLSQRLGGERLLLLSAFSPSSKYEYGPYLERVFLLQTVLLSHLSLADRALIPTDAHPQLKKAIHVFLNGFYHFTYSQLKKTPIPSTAGSPSPPHSSTSSPIMNHEIVDLSCADSEKKVDSVNKLCDLVDENLFLFLAQSFINGDISYSDFPLKARQDFQFLLKSLSLQSYNSKEDDPFSFFLSSLSKLNSDKGNGTLNPTSTPELKQELSNLESKSLELLPLHSPSFQEYFDGDPYCATKSPVTTEEEQIALKNRISPRWHTSEELKFTNERVTDSRELRSNQVYLRFMHRCAASLTGVKGLYNKPIIVKSSTPKSQQTISGKGQGKKATEIVQQNLAKQQETLVKKSLEAFLTLQKDLKKLKSLESKLSLMDTRIEGNSLDSADYLLLAAHWIKLQLLIDSWKETRIASKIPVQSQQLRIPILIFEQLKIIHSSFDHVLPVKLREELGKVVEMLGFDKKEWLSRSKVLLSDSTTDITSTPTTSKSKKNTKGGDLKEIKDSKGELKDSKGKSTSKKSGKEGKEEKDGKDSKKMSKTSSDEPTSAKVDRSLYAKLNLPDMTESSSISKYSVNMTLAHFQLNHMGPTMDHKRLADSQKDDRVPFTPDGWQVKLLNIVDKKESALICAPTSSGKTYAAYYAMQQVLETNDDDIVVYVAPTKPLVNQVASEVYARFKKTYASGNRTVWGTWTRDYRQSAMKCQVLVTVPEMLGVLLLSPLHAAWSRRIKRIIFDEVHCIGMMEGGAVWEHMLLACQVPVLCLSATVGNPEGFHSWLQKIQAKHSIRVHLVVYEHRYSDLIKWVYTPILNETGKIQMAPTPTSNKMEELMTASKRFTPVHPWGALQQGTVARSGVARAAHMSSSECLEAHSAMVKFNSNRDGLKILHPDTFFNDSLFIDRKRLLEYENELKSEFEGIARESPESCEETIQYLSCPAKESSLDLETKYSEGSIYSGDYLVKTVYNVTRDLKALEMLPAILFCFDRYNCERMAANLLQELETRETTFRDNDPEFQRKKKEAILMMEMNERSRKKMSAEDASKTDKDAEPEMEEQPIFDFNKPDPRFCFVKESSTMGSEEFKLLLREASWKLSEHLEFLAKALERGIGVHHGGLPRKYLAAVETLMRSQRVTVVFGTGTLALGINMPCKTSVFAGDSVSLTALMYRQMSGRAGRRGYDNSGNVVFWGMPLVKIKRLMVAALPQLTGHFPLTTALCLRMFMLLTQVLDPSILEKTKKDSEEDVKNSEYAQVTVNGLLTDCLFCFGKEQEGGQMKHHLRFCIEYLRRQQLLDSFGNLTHMTGFAIHLFHAEPANFAFLTLWRQNVFHVISSNFDKEPIKTMNELLFILAHLFNPRILRPKSLRLPSTLNPLDSKVTSSLEPIRLSPLPSHVGSLLDAHNLETLSIFGKYVKTYARRAKIDKKLILELPESHISFTLQEKPETKALGTPVGAGTGAHGVKSIKSSKAPILSEKESVSPLSKFRVPFEARSGFSALSGKGDSFDSLFDLSNHLHPDIFLDPYSIPFFDTSFGEQGRLNSYLCDFYSHGSIKVMERVNRIPPGDSWALLKDFMGVLISITTSLEQKALAESSLLGGGNREKDKKVTLAFTTLKNTFQEKFDNINSSS